MWFGLNKENENVKIMDSDSLDFLGYSINKFP